MMQQVPFYNIDITGGFWQERQQTVIDKTVWAVYDRFKETGRIDTMDCQKHEIKPHIFWGSDVVKWMEGAAYILEKHPNEKLLALVNELVEMIQGGTKEDGYYNSYYNNPEVDAPRFSERNNHELYSSGHMFEAGVALQHALGDDRLLQICQRNADLIDRIFRQEDSAAFVTPGHEEIELALVRLYKVTGNRRYLELSEYFVRQRGANSKDKPIGVDPDGSYIQAHVPLKEQQEAVGHAVRAVYLYCAIADLALELGDADLKVDAERLFDNIYNKKMYITGGIGSQPAGETFTMAYHLPNRTAYAETCAALGLALFARRMLMLTPDGRYGDAAERALYNGMISGLSLDGEAFFYENPLEIDHARLGMPKGHDHATQRKKVFNCSCCPPNLVRLIPSIADFIYTFDDDYLYVHQYMDNSGIAANVAVTMKTAYPADGKVYVHFAGAKKLALRRPAWCSKVITKQPYTEKLGYLYFDTNEVTIEYVMEPVFYTASDAVHEDAGRVALMRGPIVYCLESQDQPASVFRCRVDITAPVKVQAETFGGYPLLEAEGYVVPEQKALYAPAAASAPMERCKLRYIPFYTFANRGEDDMQVWVLKSNL